MRKNYDTSTCTFGYLFVQRTFTSDCLQDKLGEMDSLSSAAAELVKSGDEEGAAAGDKVKSLREQWNTAHSVVEQRVKLALSYVGFHKKAQQVSGTVLS